MANPIKVNPITTADIQELDSQGISREIINGRWADVSEDEGVAAGKRHGKIGARIITPLVLFVDEHGLGEVYQDQTGYILEGTKDNVILMLIPDISFVLKSRLVDDNPDDYYYLAPDLAVEIISPTEKAINIQAKLSHYLRYGVQQVWQVYPASKQIIVFLNDGSARIYKPGDMISGGDLLPGFMLDVATIFKTYGVKQVWQLVRYYAPLSI